jgi:hypothetical protein
MKEVVMRKVLSVVLMGLLVTAGCGGALAQSSRQAEARALEKVKAKVARLGVGEKARAQIKLRSGQKIKGYLSSAGQNDFTLTELKSGATTTVAYADVVEVKKPGLSRGKKSRLLPESAWARWRYLPRWWCIL